MKLYHATRRSTWRRILLDGRLRADKATGRRKAVWLVPPSKRLWAVCHVAQRHGVPLSEVVVIEVNVSRRSVHRHPRHTWYSYQDVPVSATARVTGLVEVAV